MKLVNSSADARFQHWRNLQVELKWAYDGPVQIMDRNRKYDGFEIPAWYLRKGRGVLEFADRQEVLPLNAWFFPSQENGWQKFSADAHLVSVRFLAKWPTGEMLYDQSHSLQIPPQKSATLLRIAERIVRKIHQRFHGSRFSLPNEFANPEDYFEIERLLYGWLLAYCQAMTAAGQSPRTLGQLDARVRMVLHILETRSLNQSVREAELAREVGLSRSQLNRLFVGALGKTPADYWEMKRLRAAQTALFESPQSIKTIAYNLGFSSLPHFSAWIRRRLGKSPRELRCAAIPPKPVRPTRPA